MENRKNNNFLDYIPVRDEAITSERGEDGSIILKVPHNGFFDRVAQKFFHTPKVSSINLDEEGSFVWPLIDGKNTVYDIAQLVKAHFGESAEPLYPRLIKFLRIVESYRFIKFIKR